LRLVEQIGKGIVVARERRWGSRQNDAAGIIILMERLPLLAAALEDIQHGLPGKVGVDGARRAVGQCLHGLVAQLL
jgi:hypothetical protein